ncbi:Uncharacterised protein [Staphylococcus aureus]|nr:Uncharacterised protein [Staphylococcus aureus]
MVLITYQIILFLIISLSYYLTLNHFMAVTVGNFTSIFGISQPYSLCTTTYSIKVPNTINANDLNISFISLI